MSHNIKTIRFEVLPKKEIMIIKPLWNQLNQIHSEKSEYFCRVFEQTSFEIRITQFKKVTNKNFRLEVIFDNDLLIGYSISTIERKAKIGSIESIYIKDDYRRLGLGMKLVNTSKQWQLEQGCSKLSLAILVGNEEVLQFYIKAGYYPRTLMMSYIQTEYAKES
jgi:diamine N-acetyltransferase